ncbi:PepSY-like domain-containing protein [Nonlabens xiamenensis]|uniref:PepSY-like domain-containing protein n=1 Tax=Nonlabens xiamenensis TaxID=2341043 RepID=UPI001F0BCD4C|nr:PepSY-like domain-containing protein [Nonlabens xiamenensis]
MSENYEILFSICFSLFLIGICSCQESKEQVPAVVLANFQKKYPGENDPDFKQDDHGYWEAHFKIDGERYRADYNADGSWVETENDIKYKNLPKAIQLAIEREFPDREISEVEHVMSASKGEFYDVEFKQKGKNMDVEYRADGSKV